MPSGPHGPGGAGSLYAGNRPRSGFVDRDACPWSAAALLASVRPDRAKRGKAAAVRRETAHKRSQRAYVAILAAACASIDVKRARAVPGAVLRADADQLHYWDAAGRNAALRV